jgi:hypothetical protein
VTKVAATDAPSAAEIKAGEISNGGPKAGAVTLGNAK